MAAHDLLLLHASRASVDLVAEYYLKEAPGFTPVNILDEGVMGDLRDQNWSSAVARLRDLIVQAHQSYGVRSALVTCSAIGPEHMEQIRAGIPVRTIKIDEPMLRLAASQNAGSVALVATFPSTVDTSLAWLRHFRREMEIEVVCDPAALQALLHGDREEHDQRLRAAAAEAARRGVSGIVLAQVSMARLAPEIRDQTGLVVWDSLTTSLAGVRG